MSHPPQVTPRDPENVVHAPPQAGPLSQPPRFWNLAFTDLWERFSFYSLQALLSYYLLYSVDEGGLAVSAAVVASVVGTYGALAQLAQVVGSWMADRVMEPRKLVLYGGFLIASGHIALGILPGFTGLFVGLGLIIVGTGAMKVNLTAILGTLYDANPGLESRRDAGFTIYLAATNTGVVIGPLLAGLAQSAWGFHAGFAVAAVGMFVGLAQYCMVYKRLPAQSGIVVRPIKANEKAGLARVIALLVIVAVGLFFVGALGGESVSMTVGIVVVTVIVTYYAIMFRSNQVTATEKIRLKGLLPISLAGLIYYGFSFQIFTTVPIFVTDHVNLEVAGWRVPEAWFVSVIAIGSITASPFVSILWNRMGERQPSAMAKMSLAYVLMAVGFFGTGLATEFYPAAVPGLLILVCLAIMGISEVFIGPLMFSMGSKCMPRAFRTQGLAVMTLSIGGGSVLAGIWGMIYTHMSPVPYFLTIGVISIAGAVVLRLGAAANNRAVTAFD